MNPISKPDKMASGATSLLPPEEEIRRLRNENLKLKAINSVLVRRAEQDMDNRANPFTYFYRTVLMEKIVNRRNKELMESNRKLTEANVKLTKSRQKLTEEIKRRKAFAEKLRQSKEKAENADRSKTRFLASATHDLLQPLNSARLFLYSLKQLKPGDGALNAIQKTEKSIELAGNMIKTTLDISKIDSGLVVPDIGTFPIISLFEDLRDEFEIGVRSKNLELKIVPTSFHIKSDPMYLHCVLQNLVSNAIRFTEKGRILIGCKRRGGDLEIRVTDTGVGIKKNNLGKIFDEFYSNAQGLRKTQKATDIYRTNMGLGLSIVKRLVSLLGLSIRVSSTLKRGSVFCLTVPGCLLESAEKSNRQRAASPIAPKAALDNMRILCVENDESTLEQLMEVLGNWSKNAVGFSRLADLRKNLKKEPPKPDFIIADYHLSKRTNGVRAITDIRQAFGENIPAILVSADPSEKIKKAARGIQAEFAEKPLNMDDLHAILNRKTPDAQTR